MFITNDVALITFIPFGIFITQITGMTKKLCLTVTLMTVAANLGSMMTPIGNPQNLYLFSASGLNINGFLTLMLPYTVASAFLLTVFILTGYRKNSVEINIKNTDNIGSKSIYIYLLMFILCILSVSGLIPKTVLLIIISIGIFFVNRRLLLKADYGLLITFLCFFIFVGNMNRLENLHNFIIGILSNHERIVSVGISQIISNVPAAILLSNYTENISELIIGTNLGGLGTLIASMASLISYKQLALNYPDLKKRYLFIFTLLNIIFLIVLYFISIVLN